MPLNIKELLKDRRFLIWAGIVLAVSATIVFAILNDRREKDDEQKVNYLIETPVQTDTSHRIQLNRSVYEKEEFPEALEVFQLDDANQQSLVSQFIVKLGKTGLSRTTV